MRVEQTLLKRGDTVQALDGLRAIEPGLLLVFGAVELLKEYTSSITNHFPGAIRIGCSTAGEISGQGVTDDTCVVTAIHFDSVPLVEAATRLVDMADSHAAGVRLSRQLPLPGLRAVLRFGQNALLTGLYSNGEISPFTGGVGCKLHNQTMTITVMGEA